jgi:hypothetical protein
MKTTTLYSSLKLPQRLRAMVFAFSRADHAELHRLAAASPDGNHTVGKVRHQFGRLTHLAALHNSLLLEPCAVWLMGQTFSPVEIQASSPAETKDIEVTLHRSLAEAASIEAAFTGRITAAGMSSSDWQTFRERLLGEGAKLLLQEFLRMAAGREDPALVAQYHGAIEGYLFKDAA